MNIILCGCHDVSITFHLQKCDARQTIPLISNRRGGHARLTEAIKF